MSSFKYSYALEKFNRALRTLAVGPGDVRSRIRSSYLGFHTITANDLPKDLVKVYMEIRRTLEKRQPEDNNDSGIDATLRRMKNKTGSKIAEMIVHIQEQLCDLHLEWYAANNTGSGGNDSEADA